MPHCFAVPHAGSWVLVIQYQTYLSFRLILSFEAVVTVKWGQISRLNSHTMKSNTSTVFHWDRYIMLHLPYSTTVNNILCLKPQHEVLFHPLAPNRLCFLQPAKSPRRGGPALRWEMFSYSVSCPWSQTWCKHPEQAKQFSPCHKDVLLEGITTI